MNPGPLESKDVLPHPNPSPSTERSMIPPSPQAERGPGGEAKRWRTEPELWQRLKPIARQMRREPTEAENALWQCLRNRSLLGFKFRRQHTIERFIVDFYCAEARLVIEVDGPIHQYTQEEDVIRQAYIESQGLHVLRFSNEDVINKTEAILKQISHAFSLPHPNPSPSTKRGKGSPLLSSPSRQAERGPRGEVKDSFNLLSAFSCIL